MQNVKIVRSFWSDLFILACVYLDACLVLLLVAVWVNPSSSVFSLIFVPVGFLSVAGCGLLVNRFVPNFGIQKPVQLREVTAFGAKKKTKRSLIGKKVMKPLQNVKPKIEFSFHTCPVHGIEKYSGNYLSLHSCNDIIQTSTKQIFWKEVTPALPSK
jgi:hypothetical protein